MRKDGKDQLILDYYDAHINDGISYVEIAKALGFNTSSRVQKVCQASGRPKPLTKFQLQVKTYREQGLCCSEISDILNKDTNQIRSAANSLGMPFTNEEIEKSKCLGVQKRQQSLMHTEEWAADFIHSHCSGFEYAFGYSGVDSFVQLKCLKCNSIVSKSFTAIRNGKKTQCPVCNANKAKSKKAQQLAEVNKKKWDSLLSREYEQLCMNTCSVCGVYFWGNSKNCDDCKRKISNNRKDKRFGDRKIDSSINAKTLYQRDGGVCWICGQRCDLQDYLVKKDKNGNDCVVCGNKYPSVDHIIPVCDGGLDVWENVRLAHRQCNTQRYAQDRREHCEE